MSSVGKPCEALKMSCESELCERAWGKGRVSRGRVRTRPLPTSSGPHTMHNASCKASGFTRRGRVLSPPPPRSCSCACACGRHTPRARPRLGEPRAPPRGARNHTTVSVALKFALKFRRTHPIFHTILHVFVPQILLKSQGETCISVAQYRLAHLHELLDGHHVAPQQPYRGVLDAIVVLWLGLISGGSCWRQEGE